MILGNTYIGSEERFPEVPTYVPPGEVTASEQAQAAADEEARRARIRTIGGVALLGVVVAGTAGLLYLTREPGSIRYRRAIKYGQKKCIGHIKYAVLSHGRLKRVGKC